MDNSHLGSEFSMNWAMLGTPSGDSDLWIPIIDRLQQQGMDVSVTTIGEIEGRYSIQQHYPVLGKFLHIIDDVDLQSEMGVMDAAKLAAAYVAPGMSLNLINLLVDSTLTGKQPVLALNQPAYIPAFPLVQAFHEQTHAELMVVDFNRFLPEKALRDNGYTPSFVKLEGYMNNPLTRFVGFNAFKWFAQGTGVAKYTREVGADAFALVLDYLRDFQNPAVRQRLSRFGPDHHKKIFDEMDLAQMDAVAARMQTPEAQELLTHLRAQLPQWQKSIRTAPIDLPQDTQRIYTIGTGGQVERLADNVLITDRVYAKAEAEVSREEQEFLDNAAAAGRKVVVLSFSSQDHLPQDIAPDDSGAFMRVLEGVAAHYADKGVDVYYANTMDYDLPPVDRERFPNLFASQGRVALEQIVSHRAVVGGINHGGQGSVETFRNIWQIAIPATKEQSTNVANIANPATTKRYSMEDVVVSSGSAVHVLSEAVAEVIAASSREARIVENDGEGQVAEAVARHLTNLLVQKRQRSS